MNRKSAFIFASLILFLALAPFGAETPAVATEEAPQPSITVKKNQRMLVVTIKGDPSKVGEKAMQLLYGAFFRNATEAEKNMPISPRVRWSFSLLEARKRDWIGTYALPISADFQVPGESQVRVEDWRYGLVAEIMHFGPYGKEAASIGILKDYIAANEFTISGDFEEEYLQGRGTFTEGSPESYRTILRYQVDNIQDFPKNYVPLSGLP
jgi:hypothetical protein